MLTFYYAPRSTASVTQAVLAELGTPHEAKLTPLGPAGTKSADYLKINPNGRVPTIVHDGSVIWESAAITMYLGEAFGVEAKLYPAMGPKRGEAMKWIVWSATCLAEAGGRLAAALPRGAPGGVEPAQQDCDQAKTVQGGGTTSKGPYHRSAPYCGRGSGAPAVFAGRRVLVGRHSSRKSVYVADDDGNGYGGAAICSGMVEESHEPPSVQALMDREKAHV